MSGVLPASWQGRRCALPLHPSGGCHIQYPKPCEICVADCGRGGMCQRNAWPLHHQSGSVPAPQHPMTKGRLRSPLEPIDQPYAVWMRTIVFDRWITSRGEPAPCDPALRRRKPFSQTVDCWSFAHLSPWQFVYPLVTLLPCQGKTQAFAFGWSDRFTNSSCKCADHKTGPPRRCFENSCVITSRGKANRLSFRAITKLKLRETEFATR
jgi:hypothetical protein